MFARSRPAPFAVSLLTHGAIMAWLVAGPSHEKPKSLYAQAIAPHSSKLVWYDFRAKLPDVAPTVTRREVKPPRADVPAPQRIVADVPKAPRARQFVWQPAPKLELHTELVSPNILAVHAPRPEPPPKPKMFVPPRAARPPAGDAPVLAAPPDVRMARNMKGAPNVTGMQPAKAPPRAFVAPAASRPGPSGAPVPEPPALPQLEAGAAVSVAIVGLKPNASAPAPAPEGSHDAQFSAAPQPRPAGGTDGAVDAAVLTVPGLLIRSDVADAKPTLMARVSPTSAANLRAALRSSLPSGGAAATQGAIRVSSEPDPLWHGRDTYAMAVQMPNISSYSGSWMIWFAEREPGARGALTLPVPMHKVDPKYYPAAMADRVEGKVRLIAVIRKDGTVTSIQLIQALDERLDQSAEEAMYQWRFEPALRNGEPIEVDALIEIPFRLAPLVKR
jgi:TonB family protein